MKNILILILIFPFTIYSQDKLNKLTPSSSPASSILGMEPTAVLSPKSYQALETALYSNFTDNLGNTILPNDFAIEFTPFWAKSKVIGMSLNEYLYPKNNLDLIWRNSSFSLATTQNFILGDSSSSNGIGFGYRTSLYLGNRNDRERTKVFENSFLGKTEIVRKVTLFLEDSLSALKKLKTNKDFFKYAKPIVAAFIYESKQFERLKDAEQIVEIIFANADSLPQISKNLTEFLDAFLMLVTNKLKSLYTVENFESYIKERQGFAIDFAYANMINFPTNDFEFSIVPRQSFWLAPTYRFKNKASALKINGVFRYQWYNLAYYKNYFPAANIYEDNFDIGLAIAGEFKKFTIQFEAVGRGSNSEIVVGSDANGNELYTKDLDTDFQYIGSFSFNLTEQISLTYKLGNKFEPILNLDNTLVSMLNLNFGFGAPTQKTHLPNSK